MQAIIWLSVRAEMSMPIAAKADAETSMPTILPSTTRKSNCPSSARTITYMSEKDRPTAKSVIIAKNFPNAMESMLTGALIRS